MIATHNCTVLNQQNYRQSNTRSPWVHGVEVLFRSPPSHYLFRSNIDAMMIRSPTNKTGKSCLMLTAGMCPVDIDALKDLLRFLILSMELEE